jgi:hypothetical protein
VNQIYQPVDGIAVHLRMPRAAPAGSASNRDDVGFQGQDFHDLPFAQRPGQCERQSYFTAKATELSQFRLPQPIQQCAAVLDTGINQQCRAGVSCGKLADL